MKHIYTKFGDVYAGEEYPEMQFRDYRIFIQRNKITEYQKLSHQDKTLEKINEYGWVLRNNMIVKDLGSDFNPTQPHHQGDSYSNSFDRKTMFIFGAGASANCVYGSEKEDFKNDTLRPPLAPALFEKRFKNYYKNYKGVKQSLHSLQDDNPDVEELFEQEWKNISKENNEEVLSRHINIQYYLQEVLKDVSNKVIEDYFSKNLFAKLADGLQKIHSASKKTEYKTTSYKKFAFVSFNQDSILEHFISERFKKPLNSMDDYVNINDSPYCIFKPHGSWNWGWRFPDTSKFGNNTASWLFENNINFFQLYFELLGNHVNMIDWSTWGHEAHINKRGLGKYTVDKSQLQIIGDNINDYFPALLLPYRDKDEFSMPLKHFLNMQTCFSQVETLVIIGWKGNEDSFNRELLQYGGRINKVIIADPNPDIVIKNLEPILTKRNITPIIYDNFEHFVTSGIEKELNV